MASYLLIVDMQEVYRQPTPWRIPHLERILVPIRELEGRFQGRVLFSRHIYPSSLLRGSWERYYRRWSFYRENPNLWALLPELSPALGRVYDKEGYSAFSSAAFRRFIEREKVSHLVLAGVETDACVLATALDAVDEGIFVTIAVDAVTSQDLEAHEGALRIYRRLGDQLKVLPAAAIQP
ncbi:MAG: isochorismatase family cysteine hydrolase [Bacillota bacterium]|nr:isochorismatase family cysteine hydrolase [Bacillota bacterium]